MRRWRSRYVGRFISFDDTTEVWTSPGNFVGQGQHSGDGDQNKTGARSHPVIGGATRLAVDSHARDSIHAIQFLNQFSFHFNSSC